RESKTETVRPSRFRACKSGRRSVSAASPLRMLDGFAAHMRGQVLIERHIDAFGQEVHGAVGIKKVAAPGMVAAKIRREMLPAIAQTCAVRARHVRRTRREKQSRAG